MALTFDICDWQAWFASRHDDLPDVSVIPPMLRRRLSPLARSAVAVLMPLMEKHGPMPLVFISRHGDLSRTLGLLDDLAQGEPLSPTAFSLSVHNATAGLFSIHSGLTENLTAVSGGCEEVVPGLLEALGQLSAGEQNVICVFCDEPPPALYELQISLPAFPYALALVVGKGTRFRFGVDAGASLPGSTSPQAIQLFEYLTSEARVLTLGCNGTAWQLGRSLE